MIFLDLLGWFFSGALLINTLPHLIHGVSGEKFPSPFDKPHGKKLSEPFLNVVWAFLNLSVALVILFFIGASFNSVSVLALMAGAFLMAIFLSHYFKNKDR